MICDSYHGSHCAQAIGTATASGSVSNSVFIEGCLPATIPFPVLFCVTIKKSASSAARSVPAGKSAFVAFSRFRAPFNSLLSLSRFFSDLPRLESHKLTALKLNLVGSVVSALSLGKHRYRCRAVAGVSDSSRGYQGGRKDSREPCSSSSRHALASLVI